MTSFSCPHSEPTEKSEHEDGRWSPQTSPALKIKLPLDRVALSQRSGLPYAALRIGRLAPGCRQHWTQQGWKNPAGLGWRWAAHSRRGWGGRGGAAATQVLILDLRELRHAMGRAREGAESPAVTVAWPRASAGVGKNGKEGRSRNRIMT